MVLGKKKTRPCLCGTAAALVLYGKTHHLVLPPVLQIDNILNDPDWGIYTAVD